MDFTTFIVAWLCSVLAMSGFSALLSQVFQFELREHNLLAQLMAAPKTSSSPQSPNVFKGWLAHFGMGLFFMICYEIVWHLTGLDRTYLWSTILGMAMGIVGIIGWIGMFKVHPNPPQLHFKIFYFQLFFAHIIFCVVATVVYKFLV